MRPERGEVARYYPVAGLTAYIRVRVLCEPYELSDGTLIVKARGIEDFRTYYPAVASLDADDDGFPSGSDFIG